MMTRTSTRLAGTILCCGLLGASVMATNAAASLHPKNGASAVKLAVFQHHAAKRDVAPSEGIKGVLRRANLPESTTVTPALTYAGAHPMTVYTFSKPGAGCAALSAGGIGGCISNLNEAGGLLSVQLAIVDGGTYVWGLAANSVTSVAVTAGAHHYTGGVKNNVYLIEIADGSHGTPAISVGATTGFGIVASSTMPGIPAPAA